MDEHHRDPDDERVRTRAESSPAAEEATADDPEAQARALLEESDERVEDPDAGVPADEDDDDGKVHRTSDEATPPPDAG